MREKGAFSRHLLVVLVCSIALLCLQNGAFAIDFPINFDTLILSEKSTCGIFECRTIIDLDLNALTPAQIQKIKEELPNIKHKITQSFQNGILADPGIKDFQVQVNGTQIIFSGTIDGASQNLWGFDSAWVYWNSTWWNSTYGYRSPILFSSSLGLENYTINLTFNHASLVSAGKSQADGDDIRIVTNKSGSNVELDRINTSAL